MQPPWRMVSAAWFHAFHITTNVYNFWALVCTCAQTVILLLTGVMVLVYTRATNKQLAIAQRQFDELKKEKRRAAQAFFLIKSQWGNLEDDPTKPSVLHLWITNKRAAVYDLHFKSWRSIGWYYEADDRYFDNEATFRLMFFRKEQWGGGNLPEEFRFSISYTTRDGEQHTISYEVNGKHIVEVDHYAPTEHRHRPFERVSSVSLNPVPDYSVEPKKRRWKLFLQWLGAFRKRCDNRFASLFKLRPDQ